MLTVQVQNVKIHHMKAKLKFKSAEEKRRYEENQRSWDQLMRKYQPTKVIASPKNVQWQCGVVQPTSRGTANIPSRVTPGGSTAKVADKKYTGTLIKGIGTMHKSNMVPIIDDSYAKEIASMRR